jgi:probable rRNA maturation factor
MRVRVSTEVPLRKNEERRLKRSLLRMLELIAVGRNLELSEETIRRLNRRYLDKDEPTDVLAFPLMSREELAGLDQSNTVSTEPVGDVVVCIPVAARQAAQRDESLYEEIELLATHGLLHLLGYEDETESGAGVMDAMEKQLLGRNIVK